MDFFLRRDWEIGGDYQIMGLDEIGGDYQIMGLDETD